MNPWREPTNSRATGDHRVFSAWATSFFIRVGSACSPSRSIGHHSAFGPSLPRTPRRQHGQLELEMGEAVAHQARQRAPARRQRRLGERLRARQASSRQAVDGTSIMPPSRPCAGRRRSSTAPSPRVSQKATPWRSGRSAFGACAGSSSAMPRAARARSSPPRAEHAARPRAACRSWRRDPSAPGRSRPAAPRRQRGGQPALSSRLGRRAAASRSRTAARSPARHCRRPTAAGRSKAIARDRRRGVGADAGQRAQARLVVGEAAAMPLDHGRGRRRCRLRARA